MKANELRIGNWIIMDGYDETQIIPSNIYEWDELESICEPIPLTEEWLLTLGFEQKNNTFNLENFRFHIEKPCNYDGFIFCENHIVITDKIQHVHQLQNLYFALTNEELK